MWDVWPRSAVPTLRAYLAEHCREFVHDGAPLDPADVQDWIVSQACWLAICAPCNPPQHAQRHICACVHDPHLTTRGILLQTSPLSF